MTTLDEYIAERLENDPEFRRGYERLGPLYSLISDVIGLRLDAGITQAELAARMGRQQPAIARFEAGNTVPTLTFLQDIAEALGAKLVVGIEPAPATGADSASTGPVVKGKTASSRRRRAVKA
jgi:HTH-type transcriptional regulator/antitoxin HipB